MIDIIGKTKDYRTDTPVVYAQMSPDDYLNIVGDEFMSFSIQRKRETHKAYKRMKDDIQEGGLLPSITLAVKPANVPEAKRLLNDDKILELRELLERPGSVDILDGLQRTYILHDLQGAGEHFHIDQKLLVEFWLEEKLERLIYRIIVLNSGQKAMSVRHQVELLFMSLRETIQDRIPDLEIYMERDQSRRRRPKKFQLDIIASAYQAFISENTEVKKENIIAQQLSNIEELTESEIVISDKFDKFLHFLDIYSTLDLLTFQRYAMPDDIARGDQNDDDSLDANDSANSPVNFSNWFASSNVALGFFSAIAQFIKTDAKRERTEEALRRLIRDLDHYSNVPDPLGTTIFDEMRTAINPRRVNVGLATRRLLANGFKEFFRDSGDTDMGSCWRQAAE